MSRAPENGRQDLDYSQFKTQYNIALNDQQERAVQAVDGPVLLLAVPGSGKTTVLVTRLGYMTLGRGIPPENILTMTYTVAATADMSRRCARLFGEELAGRLEFRTINSVCARVIRYYEKAEGRRAFELISDEKWLTALVGEIMRAVTGEFPADSEIRAVRTAITYAKNQMLDSDGIRALEKDLKGFAGIYSEYARVLRERGGMDFDDQMVYARTILLRHPHILQAFRARYCYLCVDEAQDTSRIQHEIIRLLAGERGNLFMVGDEDQSIYGFRAAYPKALMDFETTYPGAQVLLMERNYRSVEPIVRAADHFIQRNEQRRPKHMVCVRGEGAPVREIPLRERKSQYARLLKMAKECREETAVLFRDNDSAIPVIDLLEREGVPYRCRSVDGGFFTNRVVRDMTDIMRLALAPDDGEIFLRVYYKLGAGITKAAAEQAARECAQGPILARLGESEQVPPYVRGKCRALQTHLEHMLEENADKAVYRILHFMGYGEYLQKRGIDENRAHILEALGTREPSVQRLLERLEELRELLAAQEPRPQAQFILSTIHSSKGLEYRRVVLMDVIDNILPKQGEDADEEEERRLFYVGMTRARDELMIFTFSKPGYGSKFARSLFPKKEEPPRGRDGRKTRITASAMTPQKPKPAAAELARFSEGCRVRHRQFGTGTVTGRSGEFVQVEFDGGVSKKLSLSVALQAGAISIE